MDSCYSQLQRGSESQLFTALRDVHIELMAISCMVKGDEGIGILFGASASAQIIENMIVTKTNRDDSFSQLKGK